MSKSVRQAWWIVAGTLLVIAGYSLSSKAGTDPGRRRPLSPAPASRPALSRPVRSRRTRCRRPPAADIKCPPGQVCMESWQCTPDGDCFHVARCVLLP